jgi:hypothetical protein
VAVTAPVAEPAMCETCGQPVIPLSRACTCNPAHGEVVHELKHGRRTICLTYGPEGQCSCPGFTPAGDADGH